MFTKIKTAFLSFIHPFIARLYEMSIETELVSGVADVENALKSAETEAGKLIDKAETLAGLAPAAAQIPVLNAVGGLDPAAPLPPVPAAAPVASTDTILTKVKDLFILSEREVKSFDVYAALATKAVTGDVDAVLGKLKSVLDYAGVKTDVWDEIVAVAKL